MQLGSGKNNTYESADVDAYVFTFSREERARIMPSVITSSVLGLSIGSLSTQTT